MNLASLSRSPLGRHVMIYTFGASALQLLRHTRVVIEGGFELLDRIAGRDVRTEAEIASLYATETAQQPEAGVTGPPDHEHLDDVAAVPPPPPPPPPSGD